MSSFRKIVFLTTQPIEFTAVTAYLTHLVEKVTLEGTVYEVGYYQARRGYIWEVIVIETGRGSINAALETHRAIKEFSPAYLFSVGMAGGIKEVALGEVVVASTARSYESAKAEGVTIKPHLEYSSPALVTLASQIAKHNQWLQKIIEPQSTLKVSVGPIVSGEGMMVAPEFTGGDAVAIDQGGIGFLQGIADNSKIQGIVIRGISELLRVKPEKKWQPIAAQNAVAFAFAMLDELPPSGASLQKKKSRSTSLSRV